MTPRFTYDFSQTTGNFSKKVDFSTGLFINNQFVESVDKGTLDLVNPANGKRIGEISAATDKDIDVAVKAAQKAFETVWGLNTPGSERGRLLFKLADLVEQNADELAALEALNVGKPETFARGIDIGMASTALRYYGGWADKNHGKTIEVDESKLAYTRVEPIGVVGQIVPWNFPIGMMAWKIGPALATGNTIIFKPSEWTPLTALRLCELIIEAGFPPGVINVVPGLGNTAGNAISSHMDIWKIAFTGSTNVGRHIMKAAATSNLKNVTLELGGKSPVLILDDSNLDEAIRWAAFGITFNQGQVCTAGSRIFVHESAYDKFIVKFTEIFKAIKVGDPFAADTYHGPQVSETQFNRILNHIESGKREGATLHLGGERHGTEGFFIKPTIFTNVTPEMTIVKEEIFGPVVVVAKFTDDDDLIRMANNSVYGLAAGVFTKDINKAITTANRLHAGSIWINSYNITHPSVPFGGYKQSGLGRELGDAALAAYTEIKAVHVNLSAPPPI